MSVYQPLALVALGLEWNASHRFWYFFYFSPDHFWLKEVTPSAQEHAVKYGTAFVDTGACWETRNAVNTRGPGADEVDHKDGENTSVTGNLFFFPNNQVESDLDLS